MTVPKPVRAWVADAEATHGPTFDAWFPAEFDWKALCADVPEMAARVGERWAFSTAGAAKARLEETAQAAFRGAHVAALALLAGYDAAVEPDDALARLCSPPTADEQDAAGDSLASDVAAVEAEIASPAQPERDAGARAEAGVERRLSDRVRHASTAGAGVIAPVRELLSEGLSKSADMLFRLGAAREPTARVLAGVVQVAVALAGLRHAVVAEVDVAAGGEPLTLDLAAIQSALGVAAT